VHREGPREVSGSKRGGDVAHVVSDRREPSGVRGTICVEDDAPTIPKVLKDVGRRVLIYTHDHLTTCLHSRESSVGLAPGRVLPAPARSEGKHEGNG